MAKFTLVDDKTEVATARMFLDGERDSKRLHLHGVGADKKILQVNSADAKVVTALLKALFDGRKGIWTVDLLATKGGEAKIEAKLKGITVATVAVKVVASLEFPGATTEPGMLARLFLAENISPSQSDYDAAKSRTSMEWMRLVLVNRLKNNPAQFNAKGAKSITDIVKAKGQFAGFEKYPPPESNLNKRINAIVKIANDDNDARQEKYVQFLQTALEVAKANLITDPCETGLYGWRTVGHGSPGGNFVPYGDPLSGNQFYTLKKEKK